MTKRILFVCVAVFAAIALAVGYGFAQERVSVTGKVDYSERFAGYVIQADDPPTQYFVVNPDKKMLEGLRKSGKPAKIEGRLTIGADHLKIEKINGKPYPQSGKSAKP